VVNLPAVLEGPRAALKLPQAVASLLVILASAKPSVSVTIKTRVVKPATVLSEPPPVINRKVAPLRKRMLDTRPPRDPPPRAGSKSR